MCAWSQAGRMRAKAGKNECSAAGNTAGGPCRHAAERFLLCLGNSTAQGQAQEAAAEAAQLAARAHRC